MTAEELERVVNVRRDHVNEYQRLRGPETWRKRAEDKVMKKALGVEDGKDGAQAREASRLEREEAKACRGRYVAAATTQEAGDDDC